MKNALLLSITSLFINNLKGQDVYRSLLDSAVLPGVVVYVAPIKDTLLNKDDMWKYREFFYEFTEPVDTNIVLEIIDNCKNVDTRSWLKDELPNIILIGNRSDKINYKTIEKKKLPKNKRKFLVKELKRFNDLSDSKRIIYSYSRPVFDKSKQYAVIKNISKYGYETTLFHRTNNSWRKIGFLQFGRF